MSYHIWKRFDFSASHVLRGLPEGHQCGRMHGHNYTVELEMASSSLDTAGFVHDYGELAPFADWLRNQLDHRHLNDLMDENPTAEHLAYWFYGTAQRLLDLREDVWVAGARVMETPKTCAEYRP